MNYVLDGMLDVLKKIVRGAEEMAHWLRTLAALPEDPGSIPSTYIVA